MTPPDHVGDDPVPHAGGGAQGLSTARLTGLLNSTYASIAAAVATRRRLPEPPAETVLTTFQSGHGYSQDGTGTSNLNDTTTYVYGSQSASMTSAGGGVTQRITKLAGATFDATGCDVLVSMYCPDITHLKFVTVYLGSSSLANNYNCAILSLTPGMTSDLTYIQSGEWVNFTIPWGAFSTTGTPTRSALTDIRVAINDDNTGNAVTLKVNKVALVPQPTSAFPNGVATFVFDDGWVDGYTEGRKKLSQYGYRATALPIVDLLGTVGYMTTAQLHELQDVHRWEIGAHAYTAAAHDNRFTSLTATQLDDEMRLNKQWLLENGFHTGADLTAYPGGIYNAAVLAAARKYFVSARGTFIRQKETLPAIEPYRLRTRGLGNGTSIATAQADVDTAKANKGWIIFTCHKIRASASDSSTFSITDFGTLVDYCASQGIPVRTLGQVLATA